MGRIALGISVSLHSLGTEVTPQRVRTSAWFLGTTEAGV